MFEQLLESSTTKKHARNPLAYAVSITVQMIAIGVLILIPLLYTEALPQQQMLSWLGGPPPPPPPPPAGGQGGRGCGGKGGKSEGRGKPARPARNPPRDHHHQG